MEVVRAVPDVRSRLPVAPTVEEARASLRLAAAAPRATSGQAPLEILVPLLRPDCPETATTLACRLARADVAPHAGQNAGRKSRLHLLYVLEVPRQLPLTAPRSEEEGEAAKALEAAQASARSEGVAAEASVARTRDAGEEIVSQARKTGCDSDRAGLSALVRPRRRPDDPRDPDGPGPRALRGRPEQAAGAHGPALKGRANEAQKAPPGLKMLESRSDFRSLVARHFQCRVSFTPRPARWAGGSESRSRWA